MSNLFDALLKSESEQGGRGSAARPNITDVLQQAERRAAAQWKQKTGEHATNGKPNGKNVLAAADMVQAAPVAAAAVPFAAPLDERTQTPDPVRLAVIDEPLTSDFQTLEPLLPESARLVAYSHRESPGAEAFRLLAVRLRHMRRERQLKKLVITSSVPREGKSLTSANLACALSAGGTQKVLLLEGDVRQPSLTQLFDLSDRPGLCDWLLGRNSIEKSIYRLAGPGVCLLPCGRRSETRLDLIQSGKMAELLEDMQALFDWIIIDSPPILPLADASILAKLADGVLLVARRGVTEKKRLEQGVEALEKSKVVGVVINSSRKSRHDYYSYGYGSQNAFESDSPA